MFYLKLNFKVHLFVVWLTLTHERNELPNSMDPTIDLVRRTGCSKVVVTRLFKSRWDQTLADVLKSSPQNVDEGIPQGSKLGLLLFTLCDTYK